MLARRVKMSINSTLKSIKLDLEHIKDITGRVVAGRSLIGSETKTERQFEASIDSVLAVFNSSHLVCRFSFFSSNKDNNKNKEFISKDVDTQKFNV
jgi:hypothetical protein